MKNRNYLCIMMFLFFSNSLNSQSFENLKMEEDKKYESHLLFRNTFGTFNSTLLVFNQQFSYLYPGIKDKYYVLYADSSKINDLSFQDSNYLPLAFLNNDTIVLKSKQYNDWIFFSVSKNEYIKNIPENLKALLEKIPPRIDRDEYFCKFEKSLDKMILFSTFYSPVFEIYSYNYDSNIVEKKEFNIEKICKYCAILNAYWINSNQLILVLFNNRTEAYTYYFYNVTNNKTVKMDFFNDYCFLDDYFDNYCIVSFSDSRPYQAGIYFIDINTMKLHQKYKIFANINQFNPLYRLGFISPTKIARMTTTSADFASFEPYLNYIKNLIDIRIEQTDR